MKELEKTQLKEKVHESLKKLENQYHPHVLKKVESTIQTMIDNNQTMQDSLNITPELMESFYDQACKYFKSGKYQDSLNIFNLLNALEITYEHSFGAGACCQYLKRYNDAIGNYLICTQQEIGNPIPHFHIYDCFMKLNKPEPALQSILTVLELTKDKPEYAVMQEKALIEAEKLKGIIKETYSSH